MRRLFWFGVGLAAGVAVARKASNTARQITPAGIAANVGDGLRELAGAVGAFGAEVRVGMVEREQELHDVVERQTGVGTGGRPRRDTRDSEDFALGATGWRPDEQTVRRSARARARRAGG
ncbi:hypothetical protein [Solihabitans fulvus]|uniref:hypothetical protein n=1 Tax=Solihabitans fulvus TaxID=1892852 RepID=UPI001CB760C9|nr:hypothetical protein [Solihabitans fulvus]